MTEQEKQELSKAVAEKYGIKPFYYFDRVMDANEIEWLHDDSARCFDLMVEHKIEILFYESYVENPADDDEYFLYANYQTKQEATRIAILRALLAKD